MDAPTHRPTIVVADDDLLFSSKIAAELESLGYCSVVVRGPDPLKRELSRAPAACIVNLAARCFDAPAAIRDAKGDVATRPVPVLGFCGHRDAARRTAARQAGCDLVVTNGAVATALGRVLRSLLTEPGQEA